MNMTFGKVSAADLVILALLVVYPLFEWRWYWPRVSRAIRAGMAGARIRFYRGTIVVEWVVTLCVLALWIARRRAWTAHWLGGIRPLRFSLGCLLAIVVIVLFVLQAQRLRKALARPKTLASLREKFASAYLLAPETAGERSVFWLASITAGVCEEIIYRGFLMSLVATWTGLIAAVIISSIVFGYGHIYLGIAQVPRTAIAGLVLALVVVGSGSLLPAMVIHAAIDWSSGEIGFRVAQASLANAAVSATVAN